MKIKLFLCCILVSSLIRADEGDLHKFEDQMNKPASSPVIEKPSNDKESLREDHREHWRENHSNEDCSGDDGPGDLGALPLGLVFGSPFYVPAPAIGDYYNKRCLE